MPLRSSKASFRAKIERKSDLRTIPSSVSSVVFDKRILHPKFVPFGVTQALNEIQFRLWIPRLQKLLGSRGETMRNQLKSQIWYIAKRNENLFKQLGVLLLLIRHRRDRLQFEPTGGCVDNCQRLYVVALSFCF